MGYNFRIGEQQDYTLFLLSILLLLFKHANEQQWFGAKVAYYGKPQSLGIALACLGRSEVKHSDAVPLAVDQ